MNQKCNSRRSHAARKAEVRSSSDLEVTVAGTRHARLERLIFEELQALLAFELADPALDEVRATYIVLSPDTGHVRVNVVLPLQTAPSREAVSRVLEALDRAAGFIRVRLAEALGLKRTPTVRFAFDRDGDAARRGQARLESESDPDQERFRLEQEVGLSSSQEGISQEHAPRAQGDLSGEEET